VGTLRIRTLPNLWNHAAAITRSARGCCQPDRNSAIASGGWSETPWKDAGDLSKLMPFWQLTSEQDRFCNASSAELSPAAPDV
jgi:hypothetical protein